MAEKSILRTALLVVLASFASLSAEAWLRAGENSEPHTAKVPTVRRPADDELDFLPEVGDEFELPDETVGIFTADLKSRLEKDLQVRLPADFRFVARVVESVENDTLPLKIVNRCYLWARKQSVYKFQHFQQAVRKQARAVGVLL